MTEQLNFRMEITLTLQRVIEMPEEDLPKKIYAVGYSGYRLNERPLYFIFQNHRLEVENVIDHWHGEDHDYFKVAADDGRVYLLKWHRIDDVWFVVRIMERLGKH